MNRKHSSGVTLLELMTVVVIVAILGTIAVSSYRGYMLRANRTEARMALLRIQAAQEKFFLQNNRYADEDELAPGPPGGLGQPTTTASGFYTIGIDDYTLTTYTAVATAAAGQTADAAACQTLSIDQNGARQPDEDTGCWR